MRNLLNEVLSTNDKGLIGFTETGEEVFLSAPKPLTINYSEINSFLRTLPENTYAQISERTKNLTEEIVVCNPYTRRN